jgi:hypothetical protein
MIIEVAAMAYLMGLFLLQRKSGCQRPKDLFFSAGQVAPVKLIAHPGMLPKPTEDI